MSSSLTPSFYPRLYVYADGNNLKSLKVTFFNFTTRSVATYEFVFSPKVENGTKTSLVSVVDTLTNASYDGA